MRSRGVGVVRFRWAARNASHATALRQPVSNSASGCCRPAPWQDALWNDAGTQLECAMGREWALIPDAK